MSGTKEVKIWEEDYLELKRNGSVHYLMIPHGGTSEEAILVRCEKEPTEEEWNETRIYGTIRACSTCKFEGAQAHIEPCMSCLDADDKLHLNWEQQKSEPDFPKDSNYMMRMEVHEKALSAIMDGITDLCKLIMEMRVMVVGTPAEQAATLRHVLETMQERCHWDTINVPEKDRHHMGAISSCGHEIYKPYFDQRPERCGFCMKLIKYDELPL